MERILQILIISIITFLLALWIITGVNSCKDKKLDATDEIASDSTTIIDSIELTDDVFGDSVSVVDSASMDPAVANTSNNSQLTDYVEDGSTSEPANIEANSTAANKPAAKTSSSSSGPGKAYMIIAGNYIDKSNAEVMKKKLLELNFNNSEIINFDLSQYFTVIAGRYKTESEAKNLVSKLKNKGIDAYVKKRQN
jgi:septal ring-binding cell division protein DamX